MSKQKFKRVQDITEQEINDATKILHRRLIGIAPADFGKVVKTWLHNFQMVHMYSNEHLIEVGTGKNKNKDEESE